MKTKMTCRETKRKLNSYIDEEMRSKIAAHISEHLLGCRSCRQDFDSLKKLNNLLRTQHTEPLPQYLSESLQNIPLHHTRKNFKINRIRRFVPIPAAAAILLTIFSALLLGKAYLNYDTGSAQTNGNYQLAHESFYTMWEEIANE